MNIQEFVDKVRDLMRNEDPNKFTTIHYAKDSYTVAFFEKKVNLNPLIILAHTHGIAHKHNGKNRIDFTFTPDQCVDKLKRWKEKPWKVVKSEPIPLSTLNNHNREIAKKVKAKEISVEELEKIIDEVEND